MNEWSIRKRILLLATVPPLVVCLSLGAFFIASQMRALNQQLLDRGVGLSRQLAYTSEQAIRQREDNLLLRLATASLEEPDVRSVTLYDGSLEPLVHAGPSALSIAPGQPSSPAGDSTVYRGQDTSHFVTPVRVSWNRDSVDPKLDPAYGTGGTSRIVGWVELEMSHSAIRVRQYQLLLITAALTALIMLGSFLYARRMADHMTAPIASMTQSVEGMRGGQLENPIERPAIVELHPLANSMNRIAEELGSTYAEMQQHVEQATEDLRETLETVEIQNIELDIARKQALEASRIKSDFLANMSHEIRTPLNSIIGFTGLLKKSPLSAEQADQLATIAKSSEVLLTIINDVLDLSKIEAGKLILDHSPINIRELIEDVLAMLAPAAHQKGLELTYLTYADVPTRLMGDPLRMKQILTNLVSNAIKFTDSGDVVVRVMMEEEDGLNVCLKLTVTDTGVGLSETQQKHLFEAFSQADASTARKYGGSGLGLVICRGLVEQMKGKLGVESEPGKGSTFWTLLPLEIDQDAPTHVRFDALNGEHVLLFEPHAHSALALGHMLSSWGIEYDRAEKLDDMTRKVSEAQLQGRGFGAAIVGVTVGAMGADRYENLLQALEQHLNCRTILLNYTSIEDTDVSRLNEHCTRQLIKPINHDRLYQALRDVLQPKPSALAAQAEAGELDAAEPKPMILAVDDNEANLKLVEALLHSIGAEVEVASSGFAAISKVHRKRFDMILMDVQMPGMDGMETTRKLRNMHSVGAYMPIVALTAHALSAERDLLLASGMDDYLTKPVSEEQLIHTILQHTGFQLSTRRIRPIDSAHAPSVRPSTRSREPVVVDVEDSVRLAAGKRSLAADLFGMLLKHIHQHTQDIRAAVSSEDADALLAHVHKLHGATRICGVPRLRQYVGDLEQQLKTQPHENTLAAVNQVIDEMAQVKAWAERHDWRAQFVGPEGLGTVSGA